MYDIFLVSRKKIRSIRWKNFKKRYPTAQKIEHILNFQQIESKAFTKMFWVVWDDTDILETFDLKSYTVSKWDESYIHCFLNEETKFANGLIVCPKNIQVSEKEFEDRYYINKKEIDIVATRNHKEKYQHFIIDSYEDYMFAVSNSKTEMFWGQWPEIEITDHTIFDLYFDPENGEFDYDRKENHTFVNLFKSKPSKKNSLVLFSIDKTVSKKEIDNRFLIDKKEHDRIVSKSKEYDIVFISYNEPNADENYEKLITRFPRAMRVSGVKGIHQAHVRAAEVASTKMFYVVDGDSQIVDEFFFDDELEDWELTNVFVWRSKNPINDLEYGYGGVKLLPRKLTLEMDVNSVDMTTSISKNFVVKNEVSNYTCFNTDPFNSWKSAFRECCKLSSKIISGQIDQETEQRLAAWTTIGKDKKYGRYVIEGAKSGMQFGKKNVDNKEELNKINDFDWLKNEFEKQFKETTK